MAEEQEEKMTKKAQAKLLDYKRLFNTELGKKVLDDLMRTHHIISPTMGNDPYAIVFREGERNVVLRILKILNTHPEQIRDRIREIENA